MYYTSIILPTNNKSMGLISLKFKAGKKFIEWPTNHSYDKSFKSFFDWDPQHKDAA